MIKIECLKQTLIDMQSVVVAYSGGVDSTLLLKLAHDWLGEDVLALTARSPSLPASERSESEVLARHIGVRHMFFESHELTDPRYVANTRQRCYICKAAMLEKMLEIATQEGYRFVIDGANADDTLDHQLGLQAAAELGVRSPLREVGIGKDEVRKLACELELPNWDKASAACLASRIPYGTPITPQNLSQVEEAEHTLRNLGFGQLRVRYHGQLARIELEPKDFPRLLEFRGQIVDGMKAARFTYITLDLAGFRSGSLHEALGDTEDD